ncbi:hypothetical protein FB381_1823 [Nocardioides albertanoniae]|uniref:Uncharacterized protein n=1 Tax=Nocardioides albertanoniae TaxID=1175486 RepID=A0A543A5T4_9ACTN|nr:hypothetical protein [Nocardioides albertanoniae]TQL67934.1 hypothetical protein FB381_1823 [Nocardioides albertanoniae]
MSWIALLLIGVGTVDFAHALIDPIKQIRWVPEAVGAAALVVFGLLAALFGRDLVAVVVVAVIVVLWGFLAHPPQGSGRASRSGAPLALLSGAIFVGVLLAPMAGDVAGPVAAWAEEAPWAWVAAARPEAVLLAFGGLLVQVSTGNVVVQLVLDVAKVANPLDGLAGNNLKGGRLLGPLERLTIFGLGLTGSIAAAGLVVAAKGLIRWPELQSFRSDNREGGDGPSINDVTEYFLVGSFVSWMTALVTLALVIT